MATLPRRPTAVSFTGGKDSTLVLHLISCPPKPEEVSCSPEDRAELEQRLVKYHIVPESPSSNSIPAEDAQAPSGLEVCLLCTFVPAGGQQSFKAHPLDLIKAQAAALGLPHVVLEVGAPFVDSYRANIASLREKHGIEVLVTGDILDVCSNFMPRAVEGSGVELLCPLWGIERRLLLELCWHYRLDALVTCVNTAKFGGSPALAAAAAAQQQPQAAAVAASTSADACSGACGAAEGGAAAAAAAATEPLPPPPPLPLGLPLTRELLERVLLPAKALWGVDECGEWGEFHTMVMDGRLFAARVDWAYSPEPRQEGDYRFLVVASA